MSKYTTDEVSFKNTLLILNDERNKALSLPTTNMFKTMHLIDGLVEKVVNVMDQPIDDIVLINSLVEVELISDGVISYETFILTADLDEDTLPFYTPLGSSILGRKVGQTAFFEIQDTKNTVNILSVTNSKEKQKLLTNN